MGLQSDCLWSVSEEVRQLITHGRVDLEVAEFAHQLLGEDLVKC